MLVLLLKAFTSLAGAPGSGSKRKEPTKIDISINLRRNGVKLSVMVGVRLNPTSKIDVDILASLIRLTLNNAAYVG